MRLKYSLAIKRLNKDLRDDWFSDPLKHKDLLDLHKFKSYLESNSNALGGDIAEQFNLPKPGFLLRYSLETFIYDRVIYQALIDKLIVVYDPLFHPCLYSYRLNETSKALIFQSGVDAWKRFIADISAELESGEKVLLVTDVQNYFENIRISDLKMKLDLLNENKDKNILEYIKSLITLLERWSPNNTTGIPQNQDASSFLGNVYLHHVDRYMLSKRYNYFRYVDDIRIVCHDEYDARKALKNLIIKLREVGLNVNPKKTKILRPDYSNEDFLDCVPPPNRRLEEIDALWKQRTEVSIRKTLPKIRSLVDDLISENKTEKREFRFCVNRLEKIARCRYLQFDFSNILDAVLELILRQPWSTDSLVRLLSVVDLNHHQVETIRRFALDNRKNIYEWQGYLIWQLLTTIEKKYGGAKKDFRALALKTLSMQWDKPMKAGATLYLGAYGTYKQKLNVIKKCVKINSRIIKRSLVISSQEISEEDLSKYLYPYIPQIYKDSLNDIRSSEFAGSYYEPLPDLSPKELFDDLPSIFSG